MTQVSSKGPVGDSGYTVRQGDCVESIAEAHGLLWQCVWNAPENANLKSARKNPNLLLPRDKVFLPEKDPAPQDCATDSKHRFLRKGVPSELRVIIRCAGTPIKDTPYSMNIDGVFVDGQTDAEGKVVQKISPGAKKCSLTVGNDPDKIEYELYMGKLDPVSELTGVQDRLINLGYDTSESRGDSCSATTGAICTFQSKAELPVNGEADQATVDALQDSYGS